MNQLKTRFKQGLITLIAMSIPLLSVADENWAKLAEGAVDYFDPNTTELVVNDTSYFVTDKLVIIQNGNMVSIDTLDKRERVTIFGTNNEDSD